MPDDEREHDPVERADVVAGDDRRAFLRHPVHVADPDPEQDPRRGADDGDAETPPAVEISSARHPADASGPGRGETAR
jgi:hypothetical protein